MRKKSNPINLILLLLIVACSSLTIAVAQDAAKEIRIKIEKDVNGEKESIDKIFTDPNDPELKKLLEENNMNIGDGDIDIEIDTEKKGNTNEDKDKAATLKLRLDSNDEDKLNEFIAKIEELAEDMDIDFKDIDIRKEDSSKMFKLFGDNFEDITEQLKNKSFKADSFIYHNDGDLEMFLDDIKLKLKDLNIEDFDIDGKVNKFLDSDFDTDTPNKAIMGVMIDDLEKGISITGLNEGFGAEKAGLKEGDIITAIDNKTMKSVNEVIEYIASFEPGDLVTVAYLRNGERNSAKVELMEDKTNKIKRNSQNEFLLKSSKPVMGVMIKDDGDKVVINGINDGFGAEKAGLQKEDVIISIDSKVINSVEELTNYINGLKVGDVIEVEYERAGKNKKAAVELMKSAYNNNNPKYYNWIEKFNMKDFDIDKDLFKKDTRVMIMITDLDKEDEEKLNEISPNSKLKSDDLELDGFEFFPNPSEGLFNLSFDIEDVNDTEVNIYDLNGKIIYNKFLKNFKGEFSEAIDLESNESGSYILEIIQGDKRTNKKIVVK